jgi:ClpP class serine protease
MKLVRIMHALYAEPWLITPVMHNKLCEIVADHITGAAHASAGRAESYAHTSNSGLPVSKIGNIARVEISGVIGRRVGDMAKSSGALDLDDIAAAMIKVGADKSVDGVLMVFDSPGGTVSGVPELSRLVRDVAARKPVVALASGVIGRNNQGHGSRAGRVERHPCGTR